MKNLIKQSTIAGLLLCAFTGYGQLENNRDLQQFRFPDQRGVNQFEALGGDKPFDGVKVRVGGAFAVQFQGLDHSTGTLADTLSPIGSNFNLPTANLNLDVALADGVRMHMSTYLSSKHHSEAWVKGGYIQIDKLDFIKKDFLKSLMDITTVKLGMMEINYGDYHFRRTDNARAIYNPFVGNLIMDAFNTEPGVEVYFTPGDFLIMAGLTNGKLNQSVAVSDNPNVTNAPALLGKLGYDRQVKDNLRLRLTTSIYTVKGAGRNLLYGGDRTGSRFYSVMDGGDFTGRYNPNFSNEVTAIMVNPFVKFAGLELLGTVEMSSGKALGETATRSWSQYAGDLLYRFGNDENLYVGGKYNIATGEQQGTGNDITITRLEAGAGWYMTKNMMLKAEYVMQQYDGFDDTSLLYEGEFNGVMLEAVVSF